MNYSELKSYQEAEERERERERKLYEEYKRIKEEKEKRENDLFFTKYGVTPTFLDNYKLTIDKILCTDEKTMLTMVDTLKSTLVCFYNQLSKRNGGVDINRLVTIGKHRGRSVWYLVNMQPEYAIWLHKNTNFKLTEFEVDIAKYRKNRVTITLA